MKIQNKGIFFLLILLGVFICISIVLASEPPQLLTNWPRSPTGKTLTPKTTITEFINYIYEWGIALGGLVVFIVLLIAGFNYITSVGNPTKMGESVSRIKSAFLGLALLLGSWLILHTINPELTTLRPPTFRPIGGQTLCNVDTDCLPCPEGYQCRCVGAKDGKQGVCVNTPEGKETKPCAFVRVFSKTNFDGNERRVNPGETLEPFTGLSVRAYRLPLHGETPTYNGHVPGGFCILQLALNPWSPFVGCGGEIARVIFTDINFERRNLGGPTGYTDVDINCFTLSK